MSVGVRVGVSGERGCECEYEVYLCVRGRVRGGVEGVRWGMVCIALGIRDQRVACVSVTGV